MSKEIKIKLTDKQLEALQNMYKEAKNKIDPSIDSFNKFLNITIENAIDAHIQFVSMNEKMIDMFDSTINSMGLNNNVDMNNIDEFINNIFNKNINNPHDRKKNEQKDNNFPSKTSKIKN